MKNHTQTDSVQNLCSRKLWDLLNQSRSLQLNDTTIAVIERELQKRNHHKPERSWKAPH